VIDSRCVTDCAGHCESVARTVNAYVPAAHGSPCSAPSLLSVIPAGNLPDASDRLYGPSPPVARSCWL